MKMVLDKVLLVLAALVCVAVAWALIHFLGRWFFLALAVVVFVSLYANNTKLRAMLRERGVDLRRRRHS